MNKKMPQYYLVIAMIVFSSKLFSQKLKMDSLIGKWFLDEGKKPFIIEFKHDSLFWGKDSTLAGKYSLKYIKNEKCINTNHKYRRVCRSGRYISIA
jgi:hypothetical protein